MMIEKHNFRKNERDLFSLRGLEHAHQAEAADEIRAFAQRI
jgi:hypothetical protein